MLQQYHSELGEVKEFEATARYNGFVGKWAVRTHEQLTGQGIKFFEKAQDGTERNIYYVTQKAFEKLCRTINISQDLLFD